MTDKEFKAWFEGFCEAIGDVPTKEQWEKVKRKVSQIENNSLVSVMRDPVKWGVMDSGWGGKS